MTSSAPNSMLAGYMMQPVAVPPFQAVCTDDPAEILKFALNSLERGFKVALATLSSVRGGSSRAVGSQMAIRSDGGYCGYISGGCVEPALAMDAVRAIEEGSNREVTYGDGSPYFDVVLPCGGSITVSICISIGKDVLRTALSELACRRRTSIRFARVTEAAELGSEVGTIGWREDAFTRVYAPRIRLVVFGRAVELQALIAVAQSAGYEVLTGEEVTHQDLDGVVDADTAVVFLYHDLEIELTPLAAALRCKPFYIGALGSSRTHFRRSEALEVLGFSKQEISRIKAPIGIFSKARDSTTLALSILADVASARMRALTDLDPSAC